MRNLTLDEAHELMRAEEAYRQALRNHLRHGTAETLEELNRAADTLRDVHGQYGLLAT